MAKLFKIGNWKGYGSYYIVMAETKQEALEKANADIKERNKQYGYEFLKSYKLKNVAPHETDVWHGENA